MSTEFHDPREDLTHDVEAGNVYEDSRTGDAYTVIYTDERVVLLRGDRSETRLETREMFERAAGSGRFALQADTQGSGPVSRVRDYAEELEQGGGRKDKHKAEGIREALDMLSGDSKPDDRTTIDFEDLDHIGEATATNLRAAGYSTRGDVRDASDDELLDIRGVGEAGLESIRGVV